MKSRLQEASAFSSWVAQHAVLSRCLFIVSEHGRASGYCTAFGRQDSRCLARTINSLHDVEALYWKLEWAASFDGCAPLDLVGYQGRSLWAPEGMQVGGGGEGEGGEVHRRSVLWKWKGIVFGKWKSVVL